MTNAAQAINLINPDGSRYLFSRQPDGTLINTTVPHLRGAVMTTKPSNETALRYKDGRTITFQNDRGFISREFSITDPNGNVITIARNPSNQQQITAISDPVGRQLVFTYDAGNRITSITDPIGRVVTYTYNPSGTLATVTDLEGGVTRYNYDAQNRLTQMIDARGVTVFTNIFDGNGRVSQQTMADGGVFQFVYTLANPLVPTSPVLATAVTDPLGRQTTYRFNPQGFVVQVTDAMGQSKVLTRDAGANLVLDATGNAQCSVCGSPAAGDFHFTYDANGNMLTRTDALGNTTTYTYEPNFNQVTSIRDPLGNLTRFTYDARGNLLTSIDPNNKTTSFAYDVSGLLTSVTDSLSQKTTFAYDAFGNLASSTDALGRTTFFLWDGISRPTGVKDALSRSSKITDDRLNRVVTQTDPAGGVTRFTYDPVGNLLSLTDARNNRTSFTYDSKSRVLTRMTQQGRSDTRVYDSNDNLTSFTDRRGQVSTFAYDALDRILTESYQDGATVARTYDSNSRLSLVNDSAGGVFTNSYDLAGRMLDSVGPFGTVQYLRDSRGRVTQRQVVGQAPVTYAYDPAGNLLSASSPQASVTNTFDARNQPLTMTRSNGVTSNYNYDALGRVLSLVHAKGATALNTQNYTYDAVGNRNRQTTDIAQPLITQAAISQVDSENRLLQRGGVTYTYDANGNRASETGPGGTTTYTWDSRNRLASITVPAGQTTNFRYDFTGMMIGQATSGGTSTSYVLDDLTNVALQSDSGGQQLSMLTGRGIDQHYAAVQGGGQATFGLPDAINSTVATIGAAGTSTGQFLYEPFGQTTSGAGTYPFQFTGRTPVLSGLDYFRARFYDPSAARFISEDPIEWPGALSLYAYVRNNPLSLLDPRGLLAADITGEQTTKGLQGLHFCIVGRVGVLIGEHFLTGAAVLAVGVTLVIAFGIEFVTAAAIITAAEGIAFIPFVLKAKEAVCTPCSL